MPRRFRPGRQPWVTRVADPITGWEAEADDARSWWNEEWARFPTILLNEDGAPNYWSVPAETGVFNEDWATGQSLARETVAQMQRFPEGSTALRKILRAMDHDSTIAQGFLTRIEDMLTRPSVYLESLEPGAVAAKLRGEASGERLA